jgi:poly-gamma-glutamate synthesis protein (capsule biosynthesis protein)
MMKYVRITILLVLSTFIMCGCSKTVQEETVSESHDVVVEFLDEEKESETESEPETFIEPEIDLLMVGDVLLHDNVQNSGKLADGTYNYNHLFANVKEDIESADLAIVNQEVI